MAYLVTHFILVAGHEYSTKGLDFDRMCTHRAQEWIDTLRAKVRSNGTFSSIRLTPPVTLRFLRFHFTTGVIEYIDFDLDLTTGGKVVGLTEKSWTPIANYSGDATTDPRKVCPTRTMRAITAGDYDSTSDHEYPSFISTGPNAGQVMSIVDVYTAVQQMGQKDPFMYSLVELSFFCHGFPGGPILVNSNQQPGTPKTKRDPLDKDGRRKDWRTDMGAGTGANTLKQFATAFDAPGGFLQAWGCVAVPAMRHVLVQAFVKRRMQSDAVGKALHALQQIDDDTSFDFDFSDSDPLPGGGTRPWTDDYTVDTTFFPDDPSEKTFSATFLDIKQLLARLNRKTYVYRCARHAEILAKGAFFGMEGDDEKTQRYNLMRVCIKETPAPKPPPPKFMPECPVGYAFYLQFLQTYLGFKHDPDRGYGIFDQNLVTTIMNLTA
jgi:hypothetical protein